MDNITDWQMDRSEDIGQETDFDMGTDWVTGQEADRQQEPNQEPARPLSPEEEYHAGWLEAMAEMAGTTRQQSPRKAPAQTLSWAKTQKTPARALHNYTGTGSESAPGQAAMTVNNATDNQRSDNRFDNRPYNVASKPGSRIALDALLELSKEPWKFGGAFMPPPSATSSPAQAYEAPRASTQAHPEAPPEAPPRSSHVQPRTRPESTPDVSSASSTSESAPPPPEQQFGRMYGNLESLFMEDPQYAELMRNPLYADMHQLHMRHTMINQMSMTHAFDIIAKTLEPLFERERVERLKDTQAYENSHYGSVSNTHPDARDITQSGAISRWIEGLPQGFIRETYANILNHGTTGDVIELVNQFKIATGTASSAAGTAENDPRVLKLEAIQKSIDKSIEKWRQDALEAAKIKQAGLNKRLERLAPVRSKGTRPGLGSTGHADDYDYHAGWLEAIAEMKEKGEL